MKRKIFGAFILVAVACSSRKSATTTAAAASSDETGTDAFDDSTVPTKDAGKTKSSSSKVCTPGTTIACACSASETGTQACLSTGKGYGACGDCIPIPPVKPGCVPRTTANGCPKPVCGTQSDGCGGSLDCGGCSGGSVCWSPSSSPKYCCTPTTEASYFGDARCGYGTDGCGTVFHHVCEFGTCPDPTKQDLCTCRLEPSLSPTHCGPAKAKPARAVGCDSSPKAGCVATSVVNLWCCP